MKSGQTRMGPRNRAALLVSMAGTFLLVCAMPSLARAGNQAQISVPDLGEVLPVEGMADYAINNLTLTFELGSKGTYLKILDTHRASRVSWIRLPPLYGTPPAVHQASDGKIIIFAYVNSSVEVAMILDSKATELLRTFTGFSMSVSPNGRFIAYTPFHCVHFCGDDERELMEFAAVFDIVSDMNLKSGTPYNGVDPEDLARTYVYPKIKPYSGRFPSDLPWEGTMHSRASYYAWAPDSTHFAFLDQVEKLTGKAGHEHPIAATRYLVLATRNGSEWRTARLGLGNHRAIGEWAEITPKFVSPFAIGLPEMDPSQPGRNKLREIALESIKEIGN